MKKFVKKPLLERRISKDLERNFQAQYSLLDNMVEYGVDLIIRAMGDRPASIHDTIILGSFLKHAVSALDAVSVLSRKGCTLACMPQIRSIMEIFIYLKWIFKADTELRATAYYVWELRRKRYWIRCFIEGTREHKAHAIHIEGSIAQDIKLPYSTEKLLNEEKEYNNILSQDLFKDLNSLFDAKQKNSGKDSDWYESLGVNSIRSMAEDVGQGGNYKVFYTKFSNETHGLSLDHQIDFTSDGNINFNHIRTPKDLDKVIQYSCMYAIPLYQIIIERYLPAERSSFSENYIKSWRVPYHSTPKVKKEGDQFQFIRDGKVPRRYRKKW